MVQNSPPRTGEENQSVNKWEKENQETTRELLKVKDRLIEVERNVSCFNFYLFYVSYSINMREKIPKNFKLLSN